MPREPSFSHFWIESFFWIWSSSKTIQLWIHYLQFERPVFSRENTPQVRSGRDGHVRVYVFLHRENTQPNGRWRWKNLFYHYCQVESMSSSATLINVMVDDTKGINERRRWWHWFNLAIMIKQNLLATQSKGIVTGRLVVCFHDAEIHTHAHGHLGRFQTLLYVQSLLLVKSSVHGQTPGLCPLIQECPCGQRPTPAFYANSTPLPIHSEQLWVSCRRLQRAWRWYSREAFEC